MDAKRSNKSKKKQLFFLYTVFLFVLAVSVALMPFGDYESQKWAMYILGAVFWIGFIGTIVISVIINSLRKKSKDFNQDLVCFKNVGIINFFKNKEAAVSDIAMFVSIAGFIISRLFLKELIAMFIFAALIVFSFGMHCMLNGINYRFIQYEAGRDEEI